MHSEELVNFVRGRLREQRNRLQNEISSRQAGLRLIGEAMAQSDSFEVVEYPAGVAQAVWHNGITVDVTESAIESAKPSDGNLDGNRQPSPSPNAATESDGDESVDAAEESTESESF